ncbi:MAG: hypothetical protein BroJett025_10180 [Patescibacteria group bacterium]|nr:MAG: hypothetical protein BroJett025_10180 [Patescibacteria group bacterium]
MKKKTVSEYIKNKLRFLNPYTLVVLLVVSFFVVSLVKHQKVQLHQQLIKVEVTGQDWTNNYSQFEGYRPPLWLVKDLQIGAYEVSPDGRVVAEIVDIDFFERNGGNAQVFLYVQIETVENFSTGRTVYKGKNIEVGQKIDFHFDSVFIVGQVVDIFDTNYKNQTEEVLVSGVAKAVPNPVAQAIYKGMDIKNPYTGKVYAVVEKSETHQSFVSTLYKNEYTSNINLRTDYTVKDVDMVLRMQVEKLFENYYFSGHQVVRLGEHLSLFFPEVSIILEITDVAEVETVTR